MLTIIKKILFRRLSEYCILALKAQWLSLPATHERCSLMGHILIVRDL